MTFQDQGFLLIKKLFPARDPSAFEARLVEIYAEKTNTSNFRHPRRQLHRTQSHPPADLLPIQE
jgi:hypothetical protein